MTDAKFEELARFNCTALLSPGALLLFLKVKKALQKSKLDTERHLLNGCCEHSN